MTIEIPMRFESEPLLWVLQDVYSAGECDQFIELIESSSPRLATDNAIYRDQDRVIRDDPGVADELFRRLKPHLPHSMGGLRLVGLNDRLRFYRYRPGQKFLPHMDHWYQPSPTKITLLTVLVYFNENFEGGETLFQEQLDRLVRPKRGMVALFQHKVRHEGCEVISGTKYAMRSDVFYESIEPIEHAV